jgi:hypothetical protein
MEPPALTVPGASDSMPAVALLLTRLLANATPTARLAEPVKTITVVVALLETTALMIASFRAVTLTSPGASTCVLWISAVVWAGCWLPKALAIAGSPRKVSMALKRKFCDFPPIELKASVTPAPSPWLSFDLSASASICEVFSACTTTSPPLVTSEPSNSATALVKRTLVAITKSSPSDLPPLLSVLPPEELTLLSAVERMKPFSTASVWTAAAESVVSRTVAWTSLRTSL